MLKASNSNFGAISRKNTKIGSFCNLKSAKFAKKSGKNFKHKFWKVQHAQNIIKLTPNERGDQTHLLPIFFIVFLRMQPPSKSMSNIGIIQFYPIFAPIIFNITKNSIIFKN